MYLTKEEFEQVIAYYGSLTKASPSAAIKSLQELGYLEEDPLLTALRWSGIEFIEDLIGLDTVLVPGGTFLMGSPEDELGRTERERPQHLVTVPEFWMGKYPVTQAQWAQVAALPKIERDLEPFPSRFKGDKRPVERVSWYDAVEFCQRLSEKKGRTYRLPTEAEWEYACRADTTTPFYFGATITTDLANYDGTVFLNEPKGTERSKTTPVGQFSPNAFGLYDMHGNVIEWCQDWWHDNYEGAPTDGSAWLAHEEDAEEKRVLRGGSWSNYPRYCRSAFRYGDAPDGISINVGFRVVCE